MNKKILIIAGVSVLILLAVVLFFVFKKPITTAPNDTTSGSPFGDAPGGSSQTTFPQVMSGDKPLSVEDHNGLKKISSAPVSDGNFLPVSTSTGVRIEFIERSTGHIFDANLESGVVTRISNTTFPKIQQVIWGIPGKSFLGQSIDSGVIQSNVFEITRDSKTGQNNSFATIRNSALPPNIISASFSPDGKSILYLLGGSSGTGAYITNERGENPSSIWQSDTTEWISEWKTPGIITMTSKASNNATGILLFLNTKTKKTSTILSGISGLTTNTSPSGKKVLYGMASGNSYTTYLYSIDTKATDDGFFITIPEKCAWSQSEIFIVCGQPRNMTPGLPDLWYKGKVSFSDELWSLNIETLEMKRISQLNPTESEYIDVTNIHISPDDKYVVFTNKKDLSLWSIGLDN